jgi:LuxR family maltose regulon positive regulatory protein
MTTQLLTTKLYAPPPRLNRVARSRLLERLDEGLRLEHKLTLLSAPAGFGKTTLLSEWVARCGHSVAWLSLDEVDNDPARFWVYFVAALKTVEATIGKSVLSAFQAPQPTPVEAVLTALINEIVTVPDHFALVLDDYHLITNRAIHDGLAFLLDHQPPQLHLALSTRADPLLPLVRLRARGQLTELRASDLRFTSDEAAAFLNETMGLSLTRENVEALEARTEGWIVGLQLAALSMQGRDAARTREFVAAFTGSHHYVLEYLTEEVLQQQPEPVQRFLLETSILDRLCGPLCDAVTERGDGVEALADLNRRNLFIAPLDDAHHWFRYHHLFADLLHGYLCQSRPDDLPILHRRAATWYEENGHAGEAIRHALVAQDYQQASRIVVNNWRETFHQGWMNTAVHWLESLPPELVHRSPPLGIAYCWTLFVRGDHGRIPLYLEQAAEAFKRLAASGALPAENVEYSTVMYQVNLLHSVMARYRGDVDEAIKHVEPVLAAALQVWEEMGPAFADLAYGAGYLQMGHNYLAAGDLERAASYFDRSSRHSLASGNILAMTGAIFDLTRIRLRQKRLSEAEALCRETLALEEQPEYAGWPAFCFVHIALADVLRASNRFDEATEHLQHGLELSRRSGHVLYLAHGHIVAAQLHHAQGDIVAALAAWQEAERLAATIDNPTFRRLLGRLAKELDIRPSIAAPQPLVEPLSERELEVLRLICAGHSNREIAEELVIALDTVKRHASNIYGKLGVKRRTQAILKARELELI